ncbi:MAG: formylglycine-generating enzyme family protein [Alphaproteobacteria bacterium]
MVQNPFGLYDILGNASHWVEDCWADNYTNAPNDGSIAPVSGGNCGHRPLRGGSSAPNVPLSSFRRRGSG